MIKINYIKLNEVIKKINNTKTDRAVYKYAMKSLYDRKEDYINFIAYDIEDEIYDIVKELKELNINKLTLTRTDDSNAINQFKKYGYETINKGNIKTGSFIWILEKNFEDYEQEEATILENNKAEIIRNFFNNKNKEYKLKILNNSLIDNIYNIENKRVQMVFFYNNNYYLYDSDLDYILISDYKGCFDKAYELEECINEENKLENYVYHLNDLDKDLLKEFFILSTYEQ